MLWIRHGIRIVAVIASGRTYPDIVLHPEDAELGVGDGRVQGRIQGEAQYSEITTFSYPTNFWSDFISEKNLLNSKCWKR